MDISKYLTQTCEYSEKISNSEYVPQGVYKEPEIIPCFSDGFKAQATDNNKVNQYYKKEFILLDNRVKQGDKINGQIVSSVLDVHDFDGSIMYREAVLE